MTLPGTVPVEVMLEAYQQGFFLMAHEDGELYWHDPDPRAIIPLEAVTMNARMARMMRSPRFQVTKDKAFRKVVEACAERPSTWIDDRIIASYTDLHLAGHAHSVEVWNAGDLVGGIYGVAIGGAFFGESMFNRVPNAGKVAFHRLVEHLRTRGYDLFDTQYINAFTAGLGAVELPREAFRRSLSRALTRPVAFHP